mgnify:CR=1 FL=1
MNKNSSFINSKLLDNLAILAKKILLKYLKSVLEINNCFNYEKVESLRKYLDSFSLVKTSDETLSLAKCYFHERQIGLFQAFFHESYYEELLTLIHEYVHIVSNYNQNMFMPFVIEEGMAELVSKYALINYGKFNISKLNFENTAYLPCIELVEKMFSKTNKETFIYNYYFQEKKEFEDYLSTTFGNSIFEMLNSFKIIDPYIEEQTEDDLRVEISKIYNNFINCSKIKKYGA